MPRDVAALAQLFPVMMRVDAVAAAPRREGRDGERPDPPILRRRAFTALRELLARIADRSPVVVFIDDLHWADADSAVLLEDLLRPPDAPAVLMVACFRSEEAEAKPFLLAPFAPGAVDMAVPLSLGPMTDDEARTVIESVMPADTPTGRDDCLLIAREARGNPFFLEELARDLAMTPVAPAHGRTLADMLDRRLRELPSGARRFLETLAVCARPISPSLVFQASGLAGNERPLVALLRSAHLVRSSGSAERVEIYHDRIREALEAQLPVDDVQRVHRAMVETLEARHIDDPEALFEHALGAGARDRALTHAVHAAKKADAALAFDRAALFYRHALDLAPGGAPHLEWKEARATALANAGRPAEAAEAYLDAAADAERLHRAELERRGAEQFLIAGHIDRGVDVMRGVLGAAGMWLPRSPRTAFASLLLHRAQLRWRGLAFVERDASQVPAETLLRIDACWSVLTGLALVDSIRAWDFETRHLLLALKAGEPSRIARAFAIEVSFAALAGGPSRQRASEFAERAQAMAERLGHPHAVALSTLAAGGAAMLVGEWRKARLLADRGLSLLRDRCTGVTWELNAAQTIAVGSLLYQGDFGEVWRRLPGLVAAAHDSGNLYMETELRTRMLSLAYLAADDPDGGEREGVLSMERWGHRQFDRQRHNVLRASALRALYRGDGDAAWRLLDENSRAIRRSLLFRTQFLRLETSYLRACCALAAAAARRDAPALLAVARHEARRLAREGMRWSDPLSRLVSAAVARAEGDTAVAAQRLAAAADGFDLADMNVYAASRPAPAGRTARRRARPRADTPGGRGHDCPRRQEPPAHDADAGTRVPGRGGAIAEGLRVQGPGLRAQGSGLSQAGGLRPEARAPEP